MKPTATPSKKRRLPSIISTAVRITNMSWEERGAVFGVSPIAAKLFTTTLTGSRWSGVIKVEKLERDSETYAGASGIKCRDNYRLKVRHGKMGTAFVSIGNRMEDL